MAKKKKKNASKQSNKPKPESTADTKTVSEKSSEPKKTSHLPGSWKAMLQADYGAVLRMRNVRIIIAVLCVLGVLVFGAYLADVFIPVLISLGIAYILDPLVDKLQTKGLSRTKAVLTIFSLFLALGLLVGVWFSTSVVADVQRMSSEAGEIITDVQNNEREWIDSYNESVPDDMKVDPAEVNTQVIWGLAKEKLAPKESTIETPAQQQARATLASARADLLAPFQRLDTNNDLVLSDAEMSDRLSEMDTNDDQQVSTSEWFRFHGVPATGADSRTMAPETRDTAMSVFDKVSAGISTVLMLLLWLLLIPIYTWYFLIGFDDIVKKGREYLPGRHRDRLIAIIKEIDGMVKSFFRGRLIIVLIIMLLSTAVFWAFGVPYAFLLGFIAGIGILIPYASTLVAMVPAAILMLVFDDPIWAVALMCALFQGIQLLEQYVLTPKILGNAVELHPVTIFVGVFVMGSLFGLFGALLAIPLTAIAKTLGREFVLPYFKSLAEEKPESPEATS